VEPPSHPSPPERGTRGRLRHALAAGALAGAIFGGCVGGCCGLWVHAIDGVFVFRGLSGNDFVHGWLPGFFLGAVVSAIFFAVLKVLLTALGLCIDHLAHKGQRRAPRSSQDQSDPRSG